MRGGFQVSFLVLFVFNKACNSKRCGVFQSGQESATLRGKESKDNKVNVTFLQKGAGFKRELVSDFIKMELSITNKNGNYNKHCVLIFAIDIKYFLFK